MTPAFTIAGLGSYLPDRKLTNADLEKMVETNDEWITTRTGIRTRHIAAPGQSAAEMGARASRNALDMAGIPATDIQLILAATSSSECVYPSTACQIQELLGAGHAPAFDLQAACSGFLYCMIIADQFIRTGTYSNILIVGTERMSSLVDWKDRNTCILFGDGAGAAIVRASTTRGRILASHMGADGACGKLLYATNPNMQRTPETPDNSVAHTITIMHGKEVFKHAVKGMCTSVEAVLEKAAVPISDIRCMICHQANIRILDAVAERLKFPKEKSFVNIDRIGNISAACIPVALQEAVGHYGIQPGDKILIVAFGAGFTWGALLLEW